MDLTIALDEQQTARLQQQAFARRLSPEQLARDLLGDALSRLAEEETWGVINRRRMELIGKSRSMALSAEEAKELEQLQAVVDQRLEPLDRRLLAAAQQFRDLVEGLPDAATP